KAPRGRQRERKRGREEDQMDQRKRTIDILTDSFGPQAVDLIEEDVRVHGARPPFDEDIQAAITGLRRWCDLDEDDEAELEIALREAYEDAWERFQASQQAERQDS